MQSGMRAVEVVVVEVERKDSSGARKTDRQGSPQGERGGAHQRGALG
jgi:hypothetical protein